MNRPTVNRCVSSVVASMAMIFNALIFTPVYLVQILEVIVLFSSVPAKSGINTAISSAIEAMRTMAETDKIKAEKDNIVEQKPGIEADSEMKRKVVDALAPYIVMNTQNAAFLQAAAADIAKWNLSYEEKRLRLEEAMLTFKIPAEQRQRIADAVLKETEAKYHPYKLIAPLAGAVGGLGLLKLFGKAQHVARGLGGMRLGSGVPGKLGGPAVFRHRRGVYSGTEAGRPYQYTRPMSRPQDR